MADPTRPEPQKIDPTRVKKFWPGPITSVDFQQFLLLKVVSHNHMIVFDNYVSKIKRQFIFNQVSAQ